MSDRPRTTEEKIVIFRDVISKLKRRVDEEFPPDPNRKGTYWRKRKDEQTEPSVKGQ